jgi:hypothetical protein
MASVRIVRDVLFSLLGSTFTGRNRDYLEIFNWAVPEFGGNSYIRLIKLLLQKWALIRGKRMRVFRMMKQSGQSKPYVELFAD